MFHILVYDLTRISAHSKYNILRLHFTKIIKVQHAITLDRKLSECVCLFVSHLNVNKLICNTCFLGSQARDEDDRVKLENLSKVCSLTSRSFWKSTLPIVIKCSVW